MARRFVAQRLADLCAQRQMSISELSKASGVQRATIYRILKAQGSTELDTVDDLCKALGVDIHFFFGQKETGAKATQRQLLLRYFNLMWQEDQEALLRLLALAERGRHVGVSIE